jgi:hypothetical protein
MEPENIDYLNTAIEFPKRLGRRRNLLPVWIKIFVWMFLLFGALVPFGVLLGLLKFNFQLSLLGIATNNPISKAGLFLIVLFSLKGVTAFGLWTEKKWAVALAKIDAIISIVICVGVMIYPLFSPLSSFNLRLELIAIIPYLIKMNGIQKEWESFGEATASEPTTGDIE